MNKCGDWWGQGNGDWATRHLTEIALMYEQVWGVLGIGGLVTRDLTEIALALGMTSVGLYGGKGIIKCSNCRYHASPRPTAAGPPPSTAPYWPPLHLLQISRMPKANGCRPRTVVFTQGSEATIVACAGKVRLFPVIKVGVQASGQIYRSGSQGGRLPYVPFRTPLRRRCAEHSSSHLAQTH